MSTWGDLVREYFPNATDKEVNHILWNYTGYPEFWHGDAEHCCREQLQHLKDVGEDKVCQEQDEEWELLHVELVKSGKLRAREYEKKAKLR